jgi:hypothetical protein
LQVNEARIRDLCAVKVNELDLIQVSQDLQVRVCRVWIPDHDARNSHEIVIADARANPSWPRRLGVAEYLESVHDATANVFDLFDGAPLPRGALS